MDMNFKLNKLKIRKNAQEDNLSRININ